MTKEYYFCEMCQTLYTDEKMEIGVTRIYTQPLPKVVRDMVKESKLCKECENANENKDF